jgi:hypothetical protein
MGTSVITVEHVVPKRITSHSSLSEIVKVLDAPPLVKKETRMKPVSNWEKHAWTTYHVSRIKEAAKSAQSPDMNLTLNEILTGERISDKVTTILFAYFAGVCLLFLIIF